jgi:hypothetical protein
MRLTIVIWGIGPSCELDLWAGDVHFRAMLRASHVTTAALLALAVLGQPSEGAGASASALTSHVGMEVDDLDFEIRRQEAALQVARVHLTATQRAVQRGTASRGELEQVTADVHSLEAREAEAKAFRALKVYERDVLSRAIQPDEEKAFTLVHDLLRKQELMAQVELDFQTFRLRQQDALLSRNATSHQEHASAELDFDTAKLHVALARARQAQIFYEHAARSGRQPAADAGELDRLRTAYLQARVNYYDVGALLAKSRLEMAKDQLRRGTIAQTEFDTYQKALNAAEARIAAERKHLSEPSAPPPNSMPRTP